MQVIDLAQLNEGETHKYCISITGQASVTLVWYDWPASPAAGVTLQNDLDLVVIPGAARGLRMRGNGWHDNLNTVERVSHVPKGPAQIEVTAARVIAMAGAQKYSLVVQGFFEGALASTDGRNPDLAAKSAPRECAAVPAAPAPAPAPIVLSGDVGPAAAGLPATSPVTTQEVAPSPSPSPSPEVAPPPSPSPAAAVENTSAAVNGTVNPVSALLEGMGANTAANGSTDAYSKLVGSMLQSTSPSASPELPPPSPSPSAAASPPGRRLSEAVPGLGIGTLQQRIIAPHEAAHMTATGAPAAASAAVAQRAVSLCRERLAKAGCGRLGPLLCGGRRATAVVVVAASAVLALIVAAAVFALAGRARTHAPELVDPLAGPPAPRKRSISSLLTSSAAPACSMDAAASFSSRVSVEEGSPRTLSSSSTKDTPAGAAVRDQGRAASTPVHAADACSCKQPSSEHLLHISSCGYLFASEEAAAVHHHHHCHQLCAAQGPAGCNGGGADPASPRLIARQRSISEVHLDVISTARYNLLMATHSAPLCSTLDDGHPHDDAGSWPADEMFDVQPMRAVHSYSGPPSSAPAAELFGLGRGRLR